MTAIANIGSSTTSYKDVEIKFPQPFGEIPSEFDNGITVTATVVLDAKDFPLADHSDVFTVNVANITRYGFTARVKRIGADDGWGMNLNINYIAQTATIFN